MRKGDELEANGKAGGFASCLTAFQGFVGPKLLWVRIAGAGKRCEAEADKEAPAGSHRPLWVLGRMRSFCCCDRWL